MLPTCLLGLTGCGLSVPKIAEAWDADKPAQAEPRTPAKVPGTAQIEWEIKKRIYCDLKDAVQKVNQLSPAVLPVGEWLIPLNWSALLSLTLQVDETSGLNPGVTLNEVLPNASKVFGPGSTGTVTTSQSFSLGFGGTLSSTATRTDKFDPYWSIVFLMIPNTPRSICLPGNDPLIGRGWTAASSSPFILESDLGIYDWLLGATQVGNALKSEGAPPSGSSGGGGGGGSPGKSGGGGGGGGGGSPGRDAISYEVKFVIVSSGSVTPTWKLLRISANTGSAPFFSTGRTRTHDLIITIGPANQHTSNSNLALQVGNAVGNANRAVFSAAAPQ
jgi:hypothetical protein